MSQMGKCKGCSREFKLALPDSKKRWSMVHKCSCGVWTKAEMKIEQPR